MRFLHPLLRNSGNSGKTADPVAVLPASKTREARISAGNANQSADNLPQKQQKQQKQRESLGSAHLAQLPAAH
jgi:hypothetical protein